MPKRRYSPLDGNISWYANPHPALARITYCIQVFVIISAISLFIIVIWFPETKGLPLEELAVVFGDTEDVMVFSKDIADETEKVEAAAQVHTVESAAKDSGSGLL